MAYLTLNGWDIPIAYASAVQRWPEVGTRGRSHLGQYQIRRTALARRWRFTTIPMEPDDALSLMNMLAQRGDFWKFNPDDKFMSEGGADTFSQYRRTALAGDGSAIESRYAYDGALVRLVDPDTGNAEDVTPSERFPGAIWGGPATTNLLTAAESTPDAAGDFDVITDATISTDTNNSWYDNGSTALVTPSVNTNRVGWTVTTSIGTWYRFQARVKRFSGDAPAFRLYGDATIIEQFVPSTDDWYVLEGRFQATAATTDFLVNEGGGTQRYYLDGCMVYVEADTERMQAWTLGGNTRPATTYSYTNNILSGSRGTTLACWFRPVGSSTSTNEIRLIIAFGDLVDFGSANIRLINDQNGQRLKSVITTPAPGGSTLTTSLSSTYSATHPWVHAAVTYDGATMKLYLDGVLADEDAVPNGASPKDFAGYTTLGTTFTLDNPLAGPMVLPYVASADMIAGLASGDSAVLPMIASGDFLLGQGDDVLVHAELAPNRQTGLYGGTGGAWQNNRMSVEFSLIEATDIQGEP